MPWPEFNYVPVDDKIYAWKIRGLLIPFGIGLCIATLLFLFNAIQYTKEIYNNEFFTILFSVDVVNLNLKYVIFTLWEASVNWAVFMASLIQTGLFFKRKKIFPRVFAIVNIAHIVLIIFNESFGMILLDLDGMDKRESLGLIQMIVMTVVCIGYIQLAERSRKTFLL